MKIANCFLEETNFVSYLSNFAGNLDSVETIISTMEAISDSSVCALYVPSESDFYSLDTGAGIVAEKLYGTQHSGEVRDVLLRLQLVISKSHTFPITEAATSLGLFNLEKAGTGGLVTDKSPPEFEWWNDTSMYVVSTPDSLPVAIRKHYIFSKIEQRHFPKFCKHMFDKIHFFSDPERIKDLGVKYEDNIEKIINHLAYLNDFAISDFADGDQDKLIIGKAGAKGVEISPEGFKTRHNSDAMNERCITINGEKICCEWHTKIEETRGRIHFYAWTNRPDKVRSEVGNKLIIGRFADHLTV